MTSSQKTHFRYSTRDLQLFSLVHFQQADLVQRKNIGLWLQKSWFNSRGWHIDFFLLLSRLPALTSIFLFVAGVNCPPCKKICGKTLNCKNHTCEALCHTGKCQDCPKTIVLTCFCGGESKEVSCQVGYDLDHSIPKSCRGGHKVSFDPCDPYPFFFVSSFNMVILDCSNALQERALLALSR
jgi:hypothetical protein